VQIGRLGALTGFSLQVCAGGAALMWPNDKWIGVVIFCVGTLTLLISVALWFRANYRPRLPWVRRSESSPQDAGTVEIHPDDRVYPPTVTISLPTLERSLYVADIRFTFGEIEKDRYSELTMRVFNGSGRVVQIGNISGHIKFNAPNNTDPSHMGHLPPPTLRHDTARTAVQLEEWFLIFAQRVPGAEADKLLAMLKAEVPIHFDLSGLNIEVFPQEDQNKIERLPLWGGVSYSRGNGFGRIINAVVNIRLGCSAEVK
jgi:hypothetical protein